MEEFNLNSWLRRSQCDKFLNIPQVNEATKFQEKNIFKKNTIYLSHLFFFFILQFLSEGLAG